MNRSLVLASLWLATSAEAGTFREVSEFFGDRANNPGGLRMFEYTPDAAPANAPLMVVFHACSQTARVYHEGSGWAALADRLKFHVLYPEQQTNNNGLRCFNWAGEYGDPTNLRRGEGENQSVKNMIDRMRTARMIDPARIYAAGHSGGAAMVSLMLATWPDLFAGGAMIAGIPYNCTTTFTEVSTCLSPGLDRTPAQWGDRARAGHMSYRGPYPKVSIWHGSSDGTVAIRNMGELLEQWTNVHGIDTTADLTTMVDGHPRREYRDGAGQTKVELYELAGFGHGTPVVPSTGCGQTGAFFLDGGICSSARIAEFFGLSGAPMPRDTAPPTVRLTAPANGATVSGTVNITAEASDDTAVRDVELAINGTVKRTVTAAPYGYAWNAAAEPNGAYTIRARACDAAGNCAAAELTVTVMGAVVDTRAPTVNITQPATGSTVMGTVRIVAEAADDFAVRDVELFIDGISLGKRTSPPYELDWDTSAVAPGSHTLSAKATDAANNEGLDMDTSVTVERPAMSGDTTPPTVRITAPTGGEVLGVVTVRAEATDDTRVGSVLLFLDGELIGSDYTAPYEFLWDTSLVSEGAHALVARAFDAAGNLANSPEVAVSVKHEAAGEEPDPPAADPIYLGKKRWGCTSTSAEGLAWIAALALVIRRKRCAA